MSLGWLEAKGIIAHDVAIVRKALDYLGQTNVEIAGQSVVRMFYLTEDGQKVLNELLKDPRYKGDLWQKETKTFLKNKKKCELEAFSRYGLTHIVDKYLPERFKELES